MKLENTLTKEQHSIYNHNKCLAWKYFYPDGKGKNKPGYCLHHIDDSLRHTDIERYIQWNVDDLVMLTKAEHMSLHKKGKTLSEEHCAKLSESMKGKTKSAVARHKMSANNAHYWKGKKHSDETRRKMSESQKGERNPAFGRHWYYDKYGNKFYLFASDQRVINKEVVTLEEYRKII